jgi:hypothetical protein
MTDESIMWSKGLGGWLVVLVPVLLVAVLIEYIFFA